MGTEPTAAARWMGYWPRRSRTLVDAGGVALISRRATSKFFLEATKWRAVCQLVSIMRGKGWRRGDGWSEYLAS